MRKLHGAIAAGVTLASVMLPALQASARPLEPDLVCYMRTPAGRIVNLTGMCAGAAVPVFAPTIAVSPQAATRSDSAFIRSYKQRVSTVDNVAAARYLTQEANQIPDKLTDVGSIVCRGERSRLSRPGIITLIEKVLPTDNQNAVLHYAGLQRISILLDMAEAGDCP